MSEQYTSLYDNRKEMLKGINKERYVERMDAFRADYGYILNGMITRAENAEDAAEEGRAIGGELISGVKNTYFAKGKVRYPDQVDFTMFTVYYIFPALQLTASPCAAAVCDGIVAAWPNLFTGAEIGYTTYEHLRDSFRETILGFPFKRKKK